MVHAQQYYYFGVLLRFLNRSSADIRISKEAAQRVVLLFSGVA